MREDRISKTKFVCIKRNVKLSSQGRVFIDAIGV